jgi:segregation and condensation protein B
MEQDNLKNTLEALLFVSSSPLKPKFLAKFLEMDEEAVKKALDVLAAERASLGIVLLNNNGEYQLSTNSQYSTQVKNFLNAELREKLTDATVEVLAIIAYRQPISKAEIEAIRGVNSQYSLRHLLMRGLIEKVPNPSDARSFLYQTTTEFLMHLGLNSVRELPEFEKLVAQIKLPQTPALQSSNDRQEQAEEIKSEAELTSTLAQDSLSAPNAEKSPTEPDNDKSAEIMG